MLEEKTNSSSSDDNQTVSDDNEGVDENSTDNASDDVPKSDRSAEGRINVLVGQVKELKEKLEEKEDVETKVPAPSQSGTQPKPLSAKGEEAINILKERGFVTQKEIDSKLQELQNRQTLDLEHVRLENRYGGSDGRPAYDREKIEKYMKKRGIYDPEAAYKIMNEDELYDWRQKKSEGTVKKGLKVEKGGSTAGAVTDKNTITAEKIAEKMKTPEGRAWYEKNRDKILTLMAKRQL